MTLKKKIRQVCIIDFTVKKKKIKTKIKTMRNKKQPLQLTYYL